MHTETCLQALHRRLAAFPRHADVWNDLGLVLAADGQWAAALRATEEALEINPEFTAARINRCFLLNELGNAGAAFQEFKRVVVRNPDSFETIFPLGVFCLRAGWREDGTRLLARAAEQRPSVPYVLLHLSAALREIGRRHDARDVQERARFAAAELPLDAARIDATATDARIDALRRWQNPQNIGASIITAHTVATDDGWEVATHSLLEANHLHPGHAQLMVALGKALLCTGEVTGATRWMQAVIHLYHNHHEAQVELGFLYAGEDRLEEAEHAFREAVALRPLYPDYRYHLATLLLSVDKRNEAVRELQRVLLINPGYGLATLQLANAEIDRGRPREAIALLITGPCQGWSEAWLLRAQAHARLGEREEANALLAKVLDSDPLNDEATQLQAQLAMDPA